MKNYNNPYEAPKIDREGDLFNSLKNNQDSPFLGLIATNEGWCDSNGYLLATEKSVKDKIDEEMNNLNLDFVKSEDLEDYVTTDSLESHNFVTNNGLKEYTQPVPFEYVTPEMYKQATDSGDSSSIRQALESGKTVYLTKEDGYIVPSSITFKNKTIIIEGNNNQFGYGSNDISSGLKLFTFENCNVTIKNVKFNFTNFAEVLKFSDCIVTLENIIFEFNNSSLKTGLSFTNCSLVKLRNIVCKNVKDQNDTYSTVLIHCTNSNIDAKYLYFENLYKKGEYPTPEKSNVIGDGNGNITAFLLRYTDDNINNYEQCDISNIYIKEMHNFREIDDEEKIVFEDTSGVYVQTKQNPKKVKTLKNIYGYNFGKRLIKIQGQWINIDNVQGEIRMSDGSDNEGMVMLAGSPWITDSSTKDDGYFTLTNIRSIGDIHYGIGCEANHCSITNAYFETPNKINLIGWKQNGNNFERTILNESTMAIHLSASYCDIKNLIINNIGYGLLINQDATDRPAGQHVYIDNAYLYSYDNSNGYFISSTKASGAQWKDLQFTNINVVTNDKGFFNSPDNITSIEDLVISNLQYKSFYRGFREETKEAIEDLKLTFPDFSFNEYETYYRFDVASHTPLKLRKINNALIENISMQWNTMPVGIFIYGDSCKNITFKNCIAKSDYKTYFADELGRPLRLDRTLIGTLIENDKKKKYYRITGYELATDATGKTLEIAYIDDKGIPVGKDGTKYTFSGEFGIYTKNDVVLLESLWAYSNPKSFINFMTACTKESNITLENCKVDYINGSNKPSVMFGWYAGQKCLSANSCVINSDITNYEDVYVSSIDTQPIINTVKPIQSVTTSNRPNCIKGILAYDTEKNSFICSEGYNTTDKKVTWKTVGSTEEGNG